MTDRPIETGAAKAGISKAEGERAASVVKAASEADPVTMNALNQEPWWQSGVGIFGSGGVIWSLGVLATEIGSNGLDIGSYDIATLTTAIGSLAMFIGVLIRRFVPGLKPMFSGWFK